MGAMAFWEDMQRYLYLPRLNDRNVLEQAFVKGAGSKEFFGTAYGQTGDVFEGFKFGDATIQFDDTLLLIEPEVAKRYETNLPAELKPNSGIAPTTTRLPYSSSCCLGMDQSEQARGLALVLFGWRLGIPFLRYCTGKNPGSTINCMRWAWWLRSAGSLHGLESD